MEYPRIPLDLLERLEKDHLIPPPAEAPEGDLREYTGRLRLIRTLRLRFNEANHIEE